MSTPSSRCLDDNAVTALIQQRLDDEERARAEAHLDRCEECRQLVAELALSREADFTAGFEERYALLGELGTGGMGTVFEAHDQKLDRRVAIKLLTGDADDFSSAQLLREARAAAGLEHRCIVDVYDVGVSEEGVPYVVMERVRGATLRERVRSAPLAIADAVDVVTTVAAALAEAHDAGFVHRDVKPANIMIADGRGPVGSRTRLLDFGLAELVDAASDVRSGTPAYQAPEQLTGAAATPASDQFSLALTAYELATGQRSRDIVSHPRLSRALTAVLARAAADAPDERFHSIDAFGSALAAANRSPSPRLLPIALALSAPLLGVGMWMWLGAEPEATMLSHQIVVAPKLLLHAPDAFRTDVFEVRLAQRGFVVYSRGSMPGDGTTLDMLMVRRPEAQEIIVTVVVTRYDALDKAKRHVNVAAALPSSKAYNERRGHDVLSLWSPTVDVGKLGDFLTE